MSIWLRPTQAYTGSSLNSTLLLILCFVETEEIPNNAVKI